KDKYYIGQTNNLSRRLYEHNSGQSNFTKSGLPWKLVAQKSFNSRSEAMKLECKLKSLKNRQSLLQFINSTASDH
ncbi:MAG: GIY-YIG nuclease family protein, partial [Bacillota bacterium]